MASLSAGVPDWTIELGAVGGAALDAIRAHRLGDVYMRPDLDGTHLVVTVGQVADGDRRGAVWAVATEVAHLWPRWLADDAIGLTVWVPGLATTAPAAAMVALAEGAMARSAWFAAATSTVGGPGT